MARVTAGVSARRPRKTRMAAALPTGDSAPERWLANIRISGFTLVMLVVLVLAVVVLAPSLKLLIEQREQIATLEKSVNDSRNQVSDLKTQVARWDDPAYIQAQARNRLLFVYPGEYSYLVIPTKGAVETKNGAPISKKIQTTQVDWVKSMTSSLFTAGLSKAPSDKLNSPLGK
jgi:cell division protein FtsB